MIDAAFGVDVLIHEVHGRQRWQIVQVNGPVGAGDRLLDVRVDARDADAHGPERLAHLQPEHDRRDDVIERVRLNADRTSALVMVKDFGSGDESSVTTNGSSKGRNRRRRILHLS